MYLQTYVIPIALIRRSATGWKPIATLFQTTVTKSLSFAVLTFAMRGGWMQAKLAGRRPLYGMVSLHATFACGWQSGSRECMPLLAGCFGRGALAG